MKPEAKASGLIITKGLNIAYSQEIMKNHFTVTER